MLDQFSEQHNKPVIGSHHHLPRNWIFYISQFEDGFLFEYVVSINTGRAPIMVELCLAVKDYLDTVGDIAGLLLSLFEGSNDHHVPSFYTFLLIFRQISLRLLEIGLIETGISMGSKISALPSDLDQTQNRALAPSLHVLKLMEPPGVSFITISAKIMG